MSKIQRIAEFILQAANYRVSIREVVTTLMLLALLLPIGAPVPAWAYDRLPPAQVEAPAPWERGRPLLERLAHLSVSFAKKARALASFSTENGSASSETRTELRATASLSGVVHATTNTFANLPDHKAKPTDPDRKPMTKAPISTAALLEATEQDVRDSTYTPENNVGNPPNSKELSPPTRALTGRIVERAGIANYSFDVPFASLPGRGMNATVGMTYNSRVWNKVGGGETGYYTFDADGNWLAPGFTVGYGTLKSHFQSRTILLTTNQYKTYNEVVPEGYTDPDGTRHQFECKVTAEIPNTQTSFAHTYCAEYGTTDGTLVKVIYNGTRPESAYLVDDMSAYAYTYFTLIHTDGSKVTYSAPGSQFGSNDFYREHYPVEIEDSNGNRISIVYKNGTNHIDYVVDTLGRDIKFYYDSADATKLVAVTVPGFNGGSERQTIRFYYDENVSLNYSGRFSGSASGPSTIRTLRFVYFPATGTGYRYDYHPNFGIITKITKLTGITVTSSSLTSTGAVNAGSTEAATTEYTYPNDGSQTPLTDVPKYTQRTDDWQGRTAASAAITYFDAPEPATGQDQITTITVPQTAFDVDYKTIAYNTADWMDGLPKETSVTKIYGASGEFSIQMAKTTFTWAQGTADSSGRKYPVVVRTEDTNGVNQTVITTFEYDQYNNPTVVHQYDFAAPGTPVTQLTELRRTETTYETGSGWIGNRMFHLPKEIKTMIGTTAVSKIQYEYDNSTLADAPNAAQHDPDYNLNPGEHECGRHYECDPGEYPPRCPFEIDYCPNQNPATNYRGNITKVTAFSDATLSSDTNASVHTMTYDITGNVVQASMSCCNMKTIEYSSANQYAYPTKVTKGSSPTQLVTEATYDFNTGLATSTKDENANNTNLTYDAASLRQTRVDYPNGAWATFDYNDSAFPYFIKTTQSLDTTRSVASWSFFNGAGQAFRSRSLTANGYISNDVEFDELGRATTSYNPYTVAGLSDARPSGVAFTKATAIDPLGRVTETTLQDGTQVHSYPNEATVTYTSPDNQTITGTVSRVEDQAGKQRRQVIDALGRLVRVDEPVANPGDGDPLGAVTAPHQPTYYEFDANDNLTKVDQIAGSVTQERVFAYDSLSRLRRERQIEASPTLDANGVHGTPSSTKWTGVYNYNTDSLLTDATDARGVKTTLGYDGLNRILSVSYTGESGYQTPQVTYTYDEARNDANNVPYANKGQLTTVQTAAVSVTGQSTPATVQTYDFDKAGQVVNHNQTFGTDSYNLKYGYDLAGQLTSETYPSGKTITTTVDNFGVPQTVADASQTYVSAVTFENRGLPSQIALGNGTNETYSFNDRFQLTSQSLKRGTDVLQKYDYSYGTLADLSSTTVDTTKNNGQLGMIDSYIGTSKQWSQRFGYDELGRLKEAREYKQGDAAHLTYKQVFDFDRFGNLYRKAANNPTTGQENPLAFTPIEDSDINQSTNQLATGTTYDDSGEVTADTKFRNMGFAYDANGRQIKATIANTPDAITVYDALGNRVATKDNDVWQYMIYDAFGQLVAEYGTTPTEGTGGTKFIQQDWQGSVRSATNSNGYVTARIDHQAFGDDIGLGTGLRSIDEGYNADKVTRQGYGSTEDDPATGQQHGWARKLESAAGRWDSPDPYKGSISVGNPQSFNRYSYVSNDPPNFVDPSGLLPSACAWTGTHYDCSGASWGGFYIREWDINIGDGLSYRLRDEFPTFDGYTPPPDRDPNVDPGTEKPGKPKCSISVNQAGNHLSLGNRMPTWGSTGSALGNYTGMGGYYFQVEVSVTFNPGTRNVELLQQVESTVLTIRSEDFTFHSGFNGWHVDATLPENIQIDQRAGRGFLNDAPGITRDPGNVQDGNYSGNFRAIGLINGKEECSRIYNVSIEVRGGFITNSHITLDSIVPSILFHP